MKEERIRVEREGELVNSDARPETVAGLCALRGRTLARRGAMERSAKEFHGSTISYFYVGHFYDV